MNIKQKEENFLTPKQWEKNYWKEYHTKCLECINKCKQSSKILGLSCLKFKKGD